MTQAQASKGYDSNPEIAPYFQGLREGRLLIKVCRDCSKPHFYPRALCPYCFAETDWKECSGNATLYSYSVMRKSDAPYVVAYVRLAEGVTMLSHILTQDIDALRIGMELRAVLSGAGVPDQGVAFTPR